MDGTQKSFIQGDLEGQPGCQTSNMEPEHEFREAEEQKLLEQALKTYPVNTPERWEKIAEAVPGRTTKDCMKRYKELVEMLLTNEKKKEESVKLHLHLEEQVKVYQIEKKEEDSRDAAAASRANLAGQQDLDICCFPGLIIPSPDPATAASFV
ncbi:hypothetical protein MJG53_003678 [Ovis ammon polii x Ovis aries]|uniref:Uncharacterized protein n=1 Tax=Ovis ammon polii x Ovis aries TaxID=2918886 RepID=A0ACB9VIH3_9CETA|nr:hypothetical protein MJG53_003678 [Ovis ammon polii x Ovis aries]